MPYAVELELDAEASAVVHRAWQELAAAGVTYMATSGARPHVSLAIWDTVDVHALGSRLGGFAAAIRPLPLSFDRIDSFPSGVVYLAPAASSELRHVHATFHAEFHDLGPSVWPHYRPEAWIPHCTLAMDLEPAQVAAARRIAAGIRLPLVARLEAIGIVEFRPVRELVRYALSGA